MDIIKGKEIVVEIARLLTPVERVRGIESISVNGVEQEVIDHSVDIAVPTKTSDLQNDSSFVNTTQLNSALSTKANTSELSQVAFSGSYNNLTDKPTIPSIEGLATTEYVDTQLSTKATTQQLENGVESAKTYADGIVNDAVDTLETQLSSKADTSAIPTKTSQLTNDSNFATSTDVNSKVSKSGDTMSGALQLPIMTLHDSMANTSATFTMSGDKVVITFD